MVSITNIWFALVSIVGNRTLYAQGGVYQYVVDISILIISGYYILGVGIADMNMHLL